MPTIYSRAEIFNAVGSSSTSLMLFGSFARGDSSPTSDIDVLELAERRRRPYRSGRINISVYDRLTLTRMAERGSLFVLHLRLEGEMLRDESGQLSACLEKYRRPATYEPFRLALRQLANLLDVDEEQYEKDFQAYNELAFYIIRSEVYARLDEGDHPMFSLRAISACDLVAPPIRGVLQAKDAGADYQLFVKRRSTIGDILTTSICNPYGSVEALVANAGNDNPLVVAFGLRILGRQSFELSYDLLTAPPFA
jgi:hypothetical protein